MGHRALRGVIAGLVFFVTLYARPSKDAVSPPVDWNYDQIVPAVAYTIQNTNYLFVWENHHPGSGTECDICKRPASAKGFRWDVVRGVHTS